MNKQFLGKRLLVFTAHPDDEGLAAGTMYANYKAGGKTALICATSGEKGKSHLAKSVSDAALKKIRERELLKAAKILHIDEVFFLHLPDGKVRENEKKLYAKSLPMVTRFKPDQMLGFGPDGISAHWDHIIAGKVAYKIAKKEHIPFAAFTLSEAVRILRRTSKKFLLARRKFGVYAGMPKHRKANISITIDQKVKRKAMASHVSQFGTTGGTPFSRFPQRIARRMFNKEHFVKERI